MNTNDDISRTRATASRRERLLEDHAEAGFSLIEMLIAMFVMTEVMAAILLLFTGLSDIARAQTNIAEVQQSQRISHRSITHLIREAGVGGLPATGVPMNPADPNLRTIAVFPSGIAVATRNDISAGARILPGVGGSDLVLEGSDVLIIRGVFSTPVYYLSPELATRDPTNLLLDGLVEPFTLTNKLLTIPSTFLGVAQDLQPLVDALDEDDRRVLIVRDLLNPESYGLVQTTSIATRPADCPTGCLVVNITFSDVAESANYAELIPDREGSHLVQISGGRTVPFPKRIGSVGMLEEYRYYVRPDESRQILLGDRGATAPTPVLSRMSVLPATDLMIGNRLDLSRLDIADSVFDLQVAFGIDTSPECPPVCDAASILARGVILEDGTANDEVIFNDPNDGLNLPNFADGGVGKPAFHFVRLSTLVLAGRVERGHLGVPVGQIEDRDRSADDLSFGTGGFSFVNSIGNYRRRLLSTVIDLRNLR